MGFEEALRSVAFTLARFATFTSHALILGVLAITLLVLRPAFRGVPFEPWRNGRRRLTARLEGVVQASLVGSAVATLIAIVLQAALVSSAEREDFGLDSVASIASTPFGMWHLVRFPLLVGLTILLGGHVASSALAGAGDDRRGPGRLWWGGWAVLGIGLILTSTMSGHAVVASPLLLAVANDLLHLSAGAIWFTGIVLLAVLLSDAWRDKDELDRLRLLAPVVSRFSKVAMVAVATLAVTGSLNSFLHVGRLDDLGGTSYGLTLVVKIVAFIAIVGLGAVNHFYVRRRFERAAAESRPSSAQRLFRKTVAAELVVGLTIMALTGLLTGLARTKDVPGPRETTPVANVLRKL